jgi:hypothetical protein
MFKRALFIWGLITGCGGIYIGIWGGCWIWEGIYLVGVKGLISFIWFIVLFIEWGGLKRIC